MKTLDVGQSWEKVWIISNHLVDKFIEISNDKNPLHTNSVFAKENGFEDVIVHGNILNCFISFFIGEMLPLKELIIINQQIKYITPFFINDSIKFSAILSKKNMSVNFLQFNFSFEKRKITIAKGKIDVKIL
tara:strand:+ start:110 stop:505 length:396 start_codon:yes stop_codon:yes gene_type:complete